MKSIPKINPTIMETTKCLIVKVHTSFIDLKVGALLCLYHYASFRFYCWATL